ncbi:hypothetical protein [Hyphomonas sp.]|uniref:hypothetical protein n=1 Tax=Hyphomonas sp. TaxID=87 RepID=UPI0035279BC4
MFNLRRSFAIVASLALVSLPAQAQSWGATTDPQKLPDNTSYCMLWQGEALPLMNFMATPTGVKYVVVTDAFDDVQAGTPVSFDFGDGTSVPVAPATKPKPVEHPGFISGNVSEEALSTVLTRMSLGSYGEAPMTVTAGQKTQDFHLRSVAGDSALFQSCKDKL